jgi:hypothetical protein
MNFLRCLSAVGLIVALGCGPTHEDRIAPFLLELEESPSITLTLHHDGKEHTQQLSPKGRQVLYALIESAQPHSNPAKYCVLGSIDYQSADGTKGAASLYHISDVEACLRIDRTYLRGINALGLRQLAKYPETEPAQ